MDGNDDGYNNYEWCCQRLEKGIKATKFNYSDSRRKEVTLKLVNNRSALQYSPIEEEKTCMTKIFTGKRTIPISSFLNVMYGWASSTFQKYRGSIKAKTNQTN